MLDRQHVMFVLKPANAVWTASQIVVQAVTSGDRTVVIAGTSPTLLPTGQLAYAQGSTLFVVPFDTRDWKVSGVPAPVVDGLQVIGPTLSAQVAISPAGTLAYRLGQSSSTKRTLVWVSRQGEETPIAIDPRAYRFPRLSPDGTKIAVDSTDQDRDIWIFDLV